MFLECSFFIAIWSANSKRDVNKLWWDVMLACLGVRMFFAISLPAQMTSLLLIHLLAKGRRFVRFVVLEPRQITTTMTLPHAFSVFGFIMFRFQDKCRKMWSFSCFSVWLMSRTSSTRLGYPCTTTNLYRTENKRILTTDIKLKTQPKKSKNFPIWFPYFRFHASVYHSTVSNPLTTYSVSEI